jgi:hypothetical protein
MPSVALTARDRIFDNASSNPKFYYYPSLAVNKNGDMVIGFCGSRSGSSSADYVGAYYWGRLNNGTSLSGPLSYFPARASAHSEDINGGDYAYTTLDPTDELRIWTIQTYADTNSVSGAYMWGTAFVPVTPY